MSKHRPVHSGQLYAQLLRKSSNVLVWKVLRVFDDPTHIPHAFMVKRNDPTSTKTVACNMLLDEQHYQLIREGAIERL